MPREMTAEQNLVVQGVTIPKIGFTKLSPDGLDADGVPRQLAESLERLGTDYVDLLLIHWPNPDVALEETLGAMEALRRQGDTRAIGVSNFPSALLERALELAPVVANQVEYHAYLAQPELLAMARDHDVAIAAYRPLADSRLMDDEVLRDIGAAHAKTAGQVALRWLLDQPKVVALPKSGSHDNRAANLDVFDFDLDDDERGRIAELALREERTIDPPFAPDWD